MIEKRKRIKTKRLGLTHFTKFRSSIFLAFVMGCGVGISFYPMLSPSWTASSTKHPTIRACFSPGGQCTDKIVDAINATQSSIQVMAYSFTSSQIASALVEAFKRGVDVQI